MTGIPGHDAGMCGHDETEYAQWMQGLWDQAKQFDLPVKFAVNHSP